jgi:hypothetical protein
VSLAITNPEDNHASKQGILIADRMPHCLTFAGRSLEGAGQNQDPIRSWEKQYFPSFDIKPDPHRGIFHFNLL